MPNGDVDVFFEDILKAFTFNPAVLRLCVAAVDERSRKFNTQCTVESATPGKANPSSS